MAEDGWTKRWEKEEERSQATGSLEGSQMAESKLAVMAAPIHWCQRDGASCAVAGGLHSPTQASEMQPSFDRAECKARFCSSWQEEDKRELLALADAGVKREM